METPLLAEELLLLLLDDDSGTLEASTYADTALGGALLVELALGGHVETVEGKGWFARATVHVVDHVAPPADPVLREAHGRVAEKERAAYDLVDRLGKGVREQLATRLEQRGILRREDGKVLGLFPRTTWPTVDGTHEDGVRRDLAAVLLDGAQPDERTGALVALLHAVDRAHHTVEREGVRSRDVKKRAKVVAEESGWAPDAVKDAVEASQAAMIAVMTATTVVTTSTS